MGFRRHKCKLSPTQRAKKRWQRKRNRRMIEALWGREFTRRMVFPRLLKMLNDKPFSKHMAAEFNWYERTPMRKEA